jgi:glycosyltransferase involved in cell wall biosynthesis
MKNNVSSEKMLRIGFYTGGREVPSARFRARQYADALLRFGIEMHERPSPVGNYPPEARWLRPAWLLTALFERGIQAAISHRFDVVVFQRELISTLTTFEGCFARPRVLDVDDAIWLHRRGSFAGRLARKVDAVVCGNNYLADYFSNYNRNVSVIPTAVDANRFHPLISAPPVERDPVIGWSGTAGNLVQLERLESVLRTLLKRFRRARLRVVCNRPPSFTTIPSDRVDFIRWSPDVEVSALQDLTVGLMPLQDTAWTRGKCAFKMLTYMSCGVPVVVSPVGMNAKVLGDGDVGLGAQTESEWVDAISAILTDRVASARMGAAGRGVVETQYSVDVLAEKWAGVIRDVGR